MERIASGSAAMVATLKIEEKNSMSNRESKLQMQKMLKKKKTPVDKTEM